jgi:hypothetical protein
MKTGKDAAGFQSETFRRDQQHKESAFAPSPNVASGWNASTPLTEVPSGLFYSIVAPVLSKLAKDMASRAYDVETALHYYQEAELDICMHGTVGSTAPELFRFGKTAIERIRKQDQRGSKLEKAIRKLPVPKDVRGYNSDGLKETDEDA